MSNPIEREAVLWCPNCGEARGEIQRVATGNEGVYTHRVFPAGLGKKCAVCGKKIEREPPPKEKGKEK